MNNDVGRWSAQSRLLFRVGLGIFTVTVLIGIVNGFHFVTLSRAVLLTHVHAGTLGWVTLVAMAAAYWLYGNSSAPLDGHARGVAMGMCICVPLYVLAFLSGNFVLRAVFGVPVLLLIVGVVVLLARGIGTAGASNPRLGVLLAFVTLVVGSTIGVLIQVQLAANHQFLPDSAVAGHASAQVGGYLVLFALSAIEWRLNGADDRGIAGRIQVGLLFVGGLLLATGALLNIQPLLGIFIPMDIIALVIFLVRVGPRVVSARWGEATSSRHYAVAVPWVVINLATTIYFVTQLIKDPNTAPFNVITAADHAIFLGVITNIGWGLLHDFAPDRSIAPWAENVVFWVMNLALAGFAVTLLANVQAAEKFFAPFQGLAILLGIVVFSMRLAGGPGNASPEVAPAAV
jgi:hypothetical protein